DMADLVVGEKGLLGIDELVLDQRRPFTWQRELRIRHWRQELQKIRAAQGASDARRAGRMRQIHSADARMGERASDEDRAQAGRPMEGGVLGSFVREGSSLRGAAPQASLRSLRQLGCVGASPESMTTGGDYGFRAPSLRSGPGRTPLRGITLGRAVAHEIEPFVFGEHRY